MSELAYNSITIHLTGIRQDDGTFLPAVMMNGQSYPAICFEAAREAAQEIKAAFANNLNPLAIDIIEDGAFVQSIRDDLLDFMKHSSYPTPFYEDHCEQPNDDGATKGKGKFHVVGNDDE